MTPPPSLLAARNSVSLMACCCSSIHSTTSFGIDPVDTLLGVAIADVSGDDSVESYAASFIMSGERALSFSFFFLEFTDNRPKTAENPLSGQCGYGLSRVTFIIILETHLNPLCCFKRKKIKSSTRRINSSFLLELSKRNEAQHFKKPPHKADTAYDSELLLCEAQSSTNNTYLYMYIFANP